MRPRLAAQTSVAGPPEELLLFTAMNGVDRGPGALAYPDREAWLAARHDWEARQGLTIPEWSEATHAELAARAGSLAELNEALALTMYEPDDGDEWAGRYADPREVAS